MVNDVYDVKLGIMRILHCAIYYLKSLFSILFKFSPAYKIISVILFPNKKIHEIQLKDYKVSFHVRSIMDIWSIKETFVDDFYRFNNTKLQDNPVIVDIGAGIGEFAIRAGAAFPGHRVIGFEPYNESFCYFQKNISLNGLTNVTPVEAAVSSLPGNLTIDISSGNPLQFRTVANGQIESKVNTVALIPYLDEHKIATIDVLKIDCEGGEYDILLPLKKHDLERIKFITMEYHEGLSPHNHHELHQHLEAAGFSVTCVPNIVHERIGYIYAKRN